MLNKHKRRIIEVEKRLGFLYVPIKLRTILPVNGEQVIVRFNGD